MVGLRAGQLHVVARDGCRLHLSERGGFFFQGGHFLDLKGLWRYSPWVQLHMFLYGLDQGGGVLGPYDLPQQISKKPISGKEQISFETGRGRCPTQ